MRAGYHNNAKCAITTAQQSQQKKITEMFIDAEVGEGEREREREGSERR